MNKKEKIKFAIRWNRCDFAKKELLTLIEDVKKQEKMQAYLITTEELIKNMKEYNREEEEMREEMKKMVEENLEELENMEKELIKIEKEKSEEIENTEEEIKIIEKEKSEEKENMEKYIKILEQLQNKDRNKIEKNKKDKQKEINKMQENIKPIQEEKKMLENEKLEEIENRKKRIEILKKEKDNMQKVIEMINHVKNINLNVHFKETKFEMLQTRIDLNDLLELALIENRAEFVNLILSGGQFDWAKFLKNERLMKLYNNEAVITSNL